MSDCANHAGLIGGKKMALRLDDKKAIVAEVAEVAAKATSVVAADYRGLTVTQMTDMRKEARNAGVYLKVIRNTLVRRAVEDTDFSCMQEALVGPLVLAFSFEEPGAAARLMKNFAKENDKLEVKALSMGGKLLDAHHLDALAKLPNRDEAISILMSVMLAPITKFVRTLAEPHAKLARTIAAIRDQKQAA